MDEASIPHFQLPFQFKRGKVQLVEQDTEEEVTQCVEVLVRYRKGDRIDEPDFGISDPTFAQGGADLGIMREEVAEWENRMGSVFSRPEDLATFVDRITITTGDTNG